MELIQKFGRSYAYLIPFMRSSPHLEKLTLPCYDPTTFTTITHLIRKSCPNITNISLDNVTTPVEDSRIAEMINSSQLGLRSISTPWPHRADFSMNALCGQSATLESVFISNSHEGIFTIVRKLLALCPNLRVLDACSGDRSEYLETEVPFKKLLMDPWIALKLQILKVPIENVFGNSKTWRYDHHNIFYNQLSKLEQLKELKVGYSTQTDKPSRNAPKFSLQSGLQLLGGLKKLEVLCVVGTNHEIQRQELEWMCKNWPKFERISGVSSIKVMDWWKPTDESRDFHSSMIPTNIRNILKPRLMSIESFYD
ncbi:hypothetical protein BGZ76_006796 [Entomortierella beljakovae]|nr:hypothetical protein BGZ76_006796 [Entomortierella beljakovae]